MLLLLKWAKLKNLTWFDCVWTGSDGAVNHLHQSDSRFPSYFVPIFAHLIAWICTYFPRYFHMCIWDPKIVSPAQSKQYFSGCGNHGNSNQTRPGKCVGRVLFPISTDVVWIKPVYGVFWLDVPRLGFDFSPFCLLFNTKEKYAPSVL